MDFAASDYEPSVVTAQFGDGDARWVDFARTNAPAPPVVPRWRQRRYQLNALGLVIVAGAAFAVCLVVITSVTSSGAESNANAVQGGGGLQVPLFSPAPSTIPSVTPSLSPSMLPSFLPSALPSTAPSTTPSQKPSLTPTSLPTTSFSKTPSKSASPTSSSNPTLRPSASLSDLPTELPSQSPSSLPTTTPSAYPTTAAPSVSSKPSDSYEDTFGFYVMGDTVRPLFELFFLGCTLSQPISSLFIHSYHLTSYIRHYLSFCSPTLHGKKACCSIN
jgi:hypothetical protein